MNGLPATVAERLWDEIYSQKALAWLHVDARLTLIGAGGNLRKHGLESLCVGQPAAEQAVFLEGLLPVAADYDFVPSMEVNGGGAADLYFYADEGQTWIVLLDVSGERDVARLMQQKAYDMTLLQEKEAQLNRRLEAANTALVLAHRELETSRDAVREELRRKEQELEEARTLQLSLVPPPWLGVVAGCSLIVETILEPAREVGGDLVDHFVIEDNLLVLILGDVSGKGAGAALFMARTHALFRGIAARPDAGQLFREPERAARLVNDALAPGNAHCTFVTALLAVFDIPARRLSYVRAGHVPPFLRRADGMVERLAAPGGLPFGLMEDVAYRSTSVSMDPGDELLIVTDGITEAMDAAYELFGEQRVTDLMTAPVSRYGMDLQCLLSLIRSFEAGGPRSDDIAAIQLKLATETA
jgi:serine phosphatase RsbU (regulator of sigma subunit)